MFVNINEITQFAEWRFVGSYICYYFFFRDMLESGVVDDRPYAALVSSYGKAGLMDHVDRVFQMMESSGVDAGTATFNSLINIHSKAEEPEKARSVIQLMQDKGELSCLLKVADWDECSA